MIGCSSLFLFYFWPMGVKKNLLTRKNFWTIAINSTAAFVISVLLIFYINHFITIITAGMFGYDISFNYEVIYYHIEPYQWTHDAVKLIFSAGPIVIFILGFISLIGFYSLVEEPAVAKIFFVWFTFVSFNYVFGGMLIGNLFTKGIGHVFNWMYLNSTEKMIVALLGFFGLIGTAFILARPIAISANAYFKEFNEKLFPFFITAQIIIPYLLGTVLVELYFLPEPDFNIMWFWGPMLVLIFIIFMLLNHSEELFFDEEERNVRLSKILLIIAVIFYLGVRLLLNHEFYIYWSKL
jgi:hypothetical protein